jgi:hypothetical protein
MIECKCKKWPDIYKDEEHDDNCPYAGLGGQW